MEGLNDFLRRHGVVFVNEILVEDNEYNEENIINHLRDIRDFNEILSKYKGAEYRGYKNEVGRYFEDIKILYKRHERYIKSLEDRKKEETLSEIDEYIFNNSTLTREKGKRILEVISFENYLSIIKRSMDNNEVSLGEVSLKNLKRVNGVFHIVSSKNCRITFKEMNAVRLILKLKRSGRDLDYRKIIESFTKDNNLCRVSSDFIYALVSFPYEYLRCVNNYNIKRRGLTDKEYKERMEEGFLRDKKLLGGY